VFAESSAFERLLVNRLHPSAHPVAGKEKYTGRANMVAHARNIQSSFSAIVPGSIAFAALALLAMLSIVGCNQSRTKNAAINNGLPANPTEVETAPDAAAQSDAKVSVNSSSSAHESTSPGRDLYLQHCAACHGERGDGQGIAARFLYPKPRDFQSGRFRLISTGNMVPTRDDLLAVLRRGMPGSSMPSWEHLSDKDRNLLVDEILKMRHDGLHGQIVARLKEDDEEIVEADVLADVERRTTPGEVLTTPEFSAVDASAIARGQQIFLEKGCAACHGKEGRGDGQQVMVDSEGLPTRPRDLTRGIFKGNHDPASIFRRIALSMPGTPMPASPLLSTEQKVDLVKFVLSLSSESAREAAVLKRGRLIARKVAEIPSVPDAKEWNSAQELPVHLTALWWRGDVDPELRVQALHNGKTLAVRLRWHDATPNWNVARTESFKDSAALELYRGPQEPFIGMGSATSPIDVWFWDADRQRITSPPDEAATSGEYPNTVVDIYPFTEKSPVESAEYHRPGTATANQPPISMPAEAADNQIVPSEHPQANHGGGSALSAGGPGSATFRPPVNQSVNAVGQWNDGEWTVVFRRSLAAAPDSGVSLSPGVTASVAFAIWDGARGDRNGQKMISIWQDFELENGSTSSK
jgi:mono/diheme cytochrome c family protein